MDPKYLKDENIIETEGVEVSEEEFDEELYSTSEIEELQEKINQLTSERDNFLVEAENAKQEKDKVLAEKNKLDDIIKAQNNIIQEINTERDKLSVTIDALQEKLVNVIKLYNNAIQQSQQGN